MAEAGDLKSLQSGFESQWGHLLAVVTGVHGRRPLRQNGRQGAGRRFDRCALISIDDHHVEFRAGVTVCEATAQVRLTTAAEFRGARGRLSSVAVRIGHRWVVRSMLHGAARRLAASS